MNTSTILGIIVGLATLMGGIVLKGSSLSALVNPAALVIICCPFKCVSNEYYCKTANIF